MATPGSAAAGKIDLMTVLMHELGHVMGLGHVSSAVDGTRLMAGSIDPGIRRLPSALDLGPVQSTQSSVLTYSLGAGAPSGASIDPTTGVFTWAVPRAQAVGFYQITVNVADGGTPAFTASRTFTVEVKALTNTPPTLNPIGAKTVNEETELRFTISATDLDIPTQLLTFSAVGLPDGATLDSATGVFSWTPTEEQGPGSYHVTFSATDGEFSLLGAIAVLVEV